MLHLLPHLLNYTGHTVLSATEKETLAEIRDKLEDSDYQSAFQILKRNPLTQLGMLMYWEHFLFETFDYGCTQFHYSR